MHSSYRKKLYKLFLNIFLYYRVYFRERVRYFEFKDTFNLFKIISAFKGILHFFFGNRLILPLPHTVKCNKLTLLRKSEETDCLKFSK